MKYYLVAIGGDLSAEAMPNEAEIIEVNYKHKKIIKEFLMAQAEKDIEFVGWKFGKKSSPKYLDNYYKCFEKLCDAKIFDNKYQARTWWTFEDERGLSAHQGTMYEVFCNRLSEVGIDKLQNYIKERKSNETAN